MPVDATVTIATLITLACTLVTVTAMFVTLKERVATHEERLQYHAGQITSLKSSESETKQQYAVILEMIAHINETLNEMKKRGGCP